MLNRIKLWLLPYAIRFANWCGKKETLYFAEIRNEYKGRRAQKHYGFYIVRATVGADRYISSIYFPTKDINNEQRTEIFEGLIKKVKEKYKV